MSYVYNNVFVFYIYLYMYLYMYLYIYIYLYIYNILKILLQVFGKDLKMY